LSRLLLVRHGETEFNELRRFGGATDATLSRAGYEHMEKLRDRLSAERIDAICSSNLQRAKVSAGIISAGHNVPVEICPELSEINYGLAETLTFTEISQQFPDVAQAIINRDCGLCFPGGESFSDLEKRVQVFIKRLEGYSPEQKVLIVSHSGPIIMLVCLMLGMGVEGWWHLRLDNASLSIIDNYKEGAILSLFNDTSHLNSLKPE
jgi:alpha-ribazole phosphatase